MDAFVKIAQQHTTIQNQAKIIRQFQERLSNSRVLVLEAENKQLRRDAPEFLKTLAVELTEAYTVIREQNEAIAELSSSLDNVDRSAWLQNKLEQLVRYD